MRNRIFRLDVFNAAAHTNGMEHKPSHLRLVETSPWNDPQAFKPDPAQLIRERTDLRLAQLRLRVHPPVDWVAVVCVGLAVFIVIYFTAEMLRAVLS